MEKIRFSIIIPTYNSEKEIERAISSIKNQTFNNYEIIVIDDCSTDNTYKNLLKVQGIKLIKNEVSLKAGGSRNKGIDVAKGEYIIFLDADDYLAENDTLEKIDKIIGEDKPDVVYLGFKMIGRLQDICIPTESDSDFPNRIKNWQYPNVWDVCWNKQFLKENNIKFLENKYYEDFLFYYKGILKVKTYKVASFVTHIYTTLKDDSMTADVDREKVKDCFVNVIALQEEIEKLENDKKKTMMYAERKIIMNLEELLKEYEEKLNIFLK